MNERDLVNKSNQSLKQNNVVTDTNKSIEGNVMSINNLSQISSLYSVNYSINSLCDSNQVIQNIPPPPQPQFFAPPLPGPMPIAVYPCPIYPIYNCQQINFVPQPTPVPYSRVPGKLPIPPKHRYKLVPIAPNLQKSGLDILSEVATNDNRRTDYEINGRFRYETCSTCNKTKPLNSFTKKNSGERTHTCLSCSMRKKNYYQRTAAVKRQRRS